MWPLFSPQVFNLNAPVPPANETEALNQASQYQNSYNQAFSSQPQHPVEQTEMQSEQLQSGGLIFTVYLCFIGYLLDWLFQITFHLTSLLCNYCVRLWLEIDLHPFWGTKLCLFFCFFSSWCLSFPRPVRRPSAASPAGPRLRQAGSVLLQQQRHVSRWTSQRQRHDQRLQRLVEWIQR